MDRVWSKNYPEGVPADINADHYASSLEVFDESIKDYAGRTAYINMGKSITYAELDQLSLKFAAYLQHQLGLKKGDAVAVMMPNLLQYPVCILGILRAGCVVVNVNPLYTPRELQHQLLDSQAKAIIIVENFAHTLSEVQDKVKLDHVILTHMGDMLGLVKGTIVNLVVKHVKKLIPAHNLKKYVTYKQVIAAGSAAAYKKPVVVGEDLAFLQYTGGTTGVSKGAMLTHRNMIANLEQAAGCLDPLLSKAMSLLLQLCLSIIFSL